MHNMGCCHHHSSPSLSGLLGAEWLSHSAVVQEVPGSNPGGAESVGQ